MQKGRITGLAKAAGIALKQTFAKEGKMLTRQASGYAHAKQFPRMRKPLRRQRTIVEIQPPRLRQFEGQVVDFYGAHVKTLRNVSTCFEPIL